MKKLNYYLLIVISLMIFQGCSNSQKDAKENADSINETKDTTSNADNTGGIAVTDDDAEFATEAANGGMAEVDLGKLALSKSSNPAIKEFATMMVKDHGKANEELMQLANAKNITLPSSVDDEHKSKMDDLSKKSGKDFDKGYVDAMVDGHKKTLDLMKDEAKDGKDAELKAFAGKTAPIVETHYNMIKKIKDDMK